MTLFSKDTIVFVTGAGSGIGRAACHRFAAEGATVVATDINDEAAKNTVQSLTGENHKSLQLDVTEKTEVVKALDTVAEAYGSPASIAVNCAGLMLAENFLDLSEATYDRIFSVNVKGTVLVSQELCRLLVAAGKEGSVINMSSLAAGGLPRMAIYSATKAAIEAFTTAIARELGPKGIRANTVAPGYTATPMMEPFDQEPKDLYVKENPLQRPGTAEEIAEVIVFLASNKSSYINGTTVHVDGGHR